METIKSSNQYDIVEHKTVVIDYDKFDPKYDKEVVAKWEIIEQAIRRNGDVYEESRQSFEVRKDGDLVIDEGEYWVHVSPSAFTILELAIAKAQQVTVT
jgi:uncharacterized protein (DUF1015 family)